MPLLRIKASKKNVYPRRMMIRYMLTVRWDRVCYWKNGQLLYKKLIQLRWFRKKTLKLSLQKFLMKNKAQTRASIKKIKKQLRFNR